MYNENEFDKFVELCNDANNNQKPENLSAWRRVLRRTKDKTIIEKLGMQDMSRIIFVLQKKYLTKAHKVDIGPSDWEIRCRRAVIGRASYQSVTLHFIRVENNQLIIEGESSIPSCFKEESSAVYVMINNEIIKADPSGHNADKKLFGEVYEYCRTFRVSVPLSEEALEIKFLFEIGNKKIYYRSISPQRFLPVGNCIPGQYALQNGYVLQIKDNALLVTPEKQADIENLEKSFSCNISKEMADMRKEAMEFIKNKKKPVWVFVDRIRDADDSARILFEYVKNNNIPVDAYFIIDPSAKQYNDIKKYGNTVIPFSKEHLFLYLVCDAVISSQCNGVIENPFLDRCEEVRDMYHNHKIVFLQHGVIKDDMSPTLNRYDTGIDIFITSAYKEWKSIVDGAYCYSREQVWLTGLPRFDKLYSEKSNTVLIMPTWRKEYMENVRDENSNEYVWVPKNDFYTSKYYLRWKKILDSKFLKYIHEKTNYDFVFVPHPLVKKYFQIDETEFLKKANTDSYRDLYAEAAVLITDYSSAVFDGVFLNKPVIYYQFDKKQFFKNHTYKKGYFDYRKDGFGPVCRTGFSLFLMLLSMAYDIKYVSKKYKKRTESFLQYKDNNNCKRICDKLMEL